MNIYVRYFDSETLTHSFDELIGFLSSISEINVTEEMIEDLGRYIESPIPYPKRYKVRGKNYFIMIKTTAKTMEEFKANRSHPLPQSTTDEYDEYDPASPKELRLRELRQEQEGWYECSICFKRVLTIPGTGKCQYRDTDFGALVRANSALECYNRIITHLKNRQDVDHRSQYPSARGENFKFRYIGTTLTDETEASKKEQENTDNIYTADIIEEQAED